MSHILSGNGYRHIIVYVTVWVEIQNFVTQFIPALATEITFILASSPFQHVPIFWISLLFYSITKGASQMELVVKNLPANAGDKRHWSDPWIRKIPWKKAWHPTPVLLPRKSHGWRSLVGCSPWVAKSQTRLSDFTFTFHFHALEKEMATHSSVLAWRIPETGEPVGCRLWGLTESGTTEVTKQQQQHYLIISES